MPQPPIPKFWKDRIMTHLGQIEQMQKRPSDTGIRWMLEREAKSLKKDGSSEELFLADRVPSLRSISRIRKDVWPHLSNKDQARYRLFYWPESMERSDLPWEASVAALELLREGDKLLENAWQPSIKAVRFFWHVDQAAPECPFWLRLGAAMLLMKAESNQDTKLARAVQWFLAFKPWLPGNWAETYSAAIERSSDPIPTVPEDLMPLYRINKGVASDSEFLKLVRKLKLEWLEFESETPDSSQEEQNG